jgi:hypothetical protein
MITILAIILLKETIVRLNHDVEMIINRMKENIIHLNRVVGIFLQEMIIRLSRDEEMIINRLKGTISRLSRNVDMSIAKGVIHLLDLSIMMIMLIEIGTIILSLILIIMIVCLNHNNKHPSQLYNFFLIFLETTNLPAGVG